MVYDFIYEDTEDCNWFIEAEAKFKEIWLTDAEKTKNPAVYNKAVEELEQNRLYECGYKTLDMSPIFLQPNSAGQTLA